MKIPNSRQSLTVEIQSKWCLLFDGTWDSAHTHNFDPLMVFNIEKGSHHAVRVFICIGLVSSLRDMPFAGHSLGNRVLDVCQKHAMNIRARKGNSHLSLQI